MFGGLVQRLVAQCGTKIVSGRWMGSPTNYAIYKCEGGCRIEGGGDLVLGDLMCYFDSYNRDDANTEKMAALITDIVLKFDPCNPQSLVDAAADRPWVRCVWRVGPCWWAQ